MSATTTSILPQLSDLLENYLRQPSAELAATLRSLLQAERSGEEQARSCQDMRVALAEEELSQGVYETLSAAIAQLQTPFHILNAALEMLQRRSDGSDDRLLGVLMAVHEQGLATLNTLQQALPDQARIATVMVNLNQLVHEVLLIHTQRLLASGIVIDWRPQQVLPAMQGNEGRLRCLFKQLLDNAILAIEQYRDSERLIRIDTAVHEGWLQLVIHDSGPGIDEAHRLKVFEPFYSNWPRQLQRHAGMGLTLVQETINQHGGILEIDPMTAEGCRIVIHFPLK